MKQNQMFSATPLLSPWSSECWQSDLCFFCVSETSLYIWKFLVEVLVMDFPGASDSKASAYTEGDPGSIPGSGRSPGEGNGKPPQYSCLENPMDIEAWQATVHGVAKSETWLERLHFLSFLPICKMSATVQWFEYLSALLLLWDWNENWPFPVLWPLNFLNLLTYWL